MTWEQMFGFFIFMLIALISGIAKIFEARKENQQQAQRRRARPEDLPEATRRMLYGDSGSPPVARPRRAPGEQRPTTTQEIPTARPRTQAPPTAVPPQRRQQAEYEAEHERRGPRREPVPWEVPEQQLEAPPPRPVQRREAPAPQAQPQRRPDMEETMRRAQAERQREAAKRQREAAQQRVREVHPKHRAQAQPAVRKAARRKEGMRDMLRDPASVRQAIVLREILGPPRAFS